MDEKEKNEKPIFDALLIEIVKSIDQITDRISRTEEDIKLSEILQENMRNYLMAVIENFRKLENKLHNQTRFKTIWKTIAMTHLIFDAIMLILILSVIYVPR